ncbi:hypothetical protein [Halorubrum tropicale]|uniref:hypothetical protein n=1 Tax=Halorubrum tropicale TaxID=1765655 RepID=UPI001111C054|nr:hypothetical protein [Halorubrum tropicale]
MVFRSYVLKKRLREHTCERTGNSVTPWNVSGVPDEGMFLRPFQKLLTEYDNKAARNNRLEKVLDSLEKSECIIYSIVCRISIGGKLAEIPTPEKVAIDEKTEFFDCGITISGHTSLVITDEKIQMFVQNNEDYHDGMFLDHILYSNLDAVLYSEAGEYLQIEKGDLKYRFFGSARRFDEKERHNAAQFIAESAGLDLTLHSEKPQHTANEDDVNPVSTDSDKEIEQEKSWKAHKKATDREPPVEKGDIVNIGVLDINLHHTGDRRAFGKYEGFAIHVEEVPADLSEGDFIDVKIMYFNHGRTSATGVCLTNN